MALDFPASPTNGQLDSSGQWTYNSTKQAWQAVPLTQGKTVTSPTPPSSPQNGDQWFNTNDGTLYIYYTDANTSQWVESRAPITADGYISPNYVINGGFDIWQRGTTFNSIAGNGYSADRWIMSYSGSGSTRNITQQTFTPGTDVGRESPYYININQTVAGTGGTWSEFATLIEDVRTLAGKTVTLSFWGKSSTSTAMTGVFIGQTFQGSGRIDTSFAPGGVQLTTSWKRYSYTMALPSIAGKSIGAGSYLFLAFQLPLNATYSIDISNVQLEEGTVATPFRRNANSVQGELAACMRYYQRLGTASYSPIGVGISHSGTVSGINIPLLVPMRVAPTLAEWSNLIITDRLSYDLTVQSFYSPQSGPMSYYTYVTHSATATQYRTALLNVVNGAAGYMSFSAEL